MKYSLLQKLQKIKKEFFTVADLQKVFDQKKESLYVALNRGVKSGWLRRLRKGIYQLAAASTEAEKIANQIYYPSYLSFESALSKYGIISQIPYTLTFATPRRTRRMAVSGNEVLFRQLKKNLFFGYKLSGGIYLAEREKALLDQLYLVSLGKNTLNFSEINLKEVSREKLRKLSRKFPKATQRLVSKLSEEI